MYKVRNEPSEIVLPRETGQVKENVVVIMRGKRSCESQLLRLRLEESDGEAANRSAGLPGDRRAR